LPKLKVRSAAKKRFKITGKKITKKSPFRSHLLEKKSANRKRRLGMSSDLAAGDKKNVKKMLGV